MNRLRALALIGAIVMALAVVASLVYIIVTGEDIQSAASLILGFATPTITALLVFGTTEVVRRNSSGGETNDNEHPD